MWEDHNCLAHLLVERRRIRRGLFLPRIKPIKCSKSRMSRYKWAISLVSPGDLDEALCAADMPNGAEIVT